MGGGYITKFREVNNLLNLRGKNILVVGGTGGIGMHKKRMTNNKFYYFNNNVGAASAIRFAQLGASVTIAGRSKVSLVTHNHHIVIIVTHSITYH